MAQAIAYLNDVMPYKTSWRVQVRVLHFWKTYTTAFGVTFDMVLTDVHGTKIHASVKNDCMTPFEKYMVPGEWKNIQHFGLVYAADQFRPTSHYYKMDFLAQTIVTWINPLSDDHYLSLTTFKDVETGGLNANILIDIVGQVVNVGEMETIDVNSMPTKKIDFQLRDEL